MIDVTSKKAIKAYLNCQPIQQSRQQIQYDSKNLSNRKLVTKKPSPNADKVKRNYVEVVQEIKNQTETVVNDNYHEQLVFDKALGQRKEHSAKYLDKISVLNGFSSPFEKEIFHTPRSQKKLEPNKIVAHSNKYVKKRIQTAENQRQTSQRLDSNRSQFYESSKTDDHDCEIQERAHWDTTIENVSIGSIKDNSASNSSSNISCKRQLHSRLGNASRYTLLQDQIASTECFYCRNNKRIVEILTEKNRKLEDQYKAKKGTIKDLYDLCQYFKKENANLSMQMDKNVQIYKCKQDFFFKERENFRSKVQNLKAEIQKLNQNIKYNLIQNSILIPYRDEYQLLIKEFKKIKNQNQQLRHQFITVNQFQNRPLVSKSKSRQKQQQKFKSNNKQTQNNNIIMKHKPVVDKTYQYYNKIGSANERKRNIHEDDDISLNLSEQSYSHH